MLAQGRKVKIFIFVRLYICKASHQTVIIVPGIEDTKNDACTVENQSLLWNPTPQ